MRQRLALIMILLASAPSCTKKPDASVATAQPPLTEPAVETAAPVSAQADLMLVGLDALYKQGNNAEAIATFRRVLALNPKHYGATYQLAVALERQGDPASKAQWQQVLAAATEINDAQTITDAKAHLGI